ncbi:MAG: hypothetical protein JO311_06405 [Candidatus Eremiobacteraeota bacterium]|nr:hypothetical protein [Candidatus Eremiobacteraeota bacterium]MBV9263516.1 hypothetical protein [Candidatus Eremiobacteraeota bacterium]
MAFCAVFFTAPPAFFAALPAFFAVLPAFLATFLAPPAAALPVAPAFFAIDDPRFLVERFADFPDERAGLDVRLREAFFAGIFLLRLI